VRAGDLRVVSAPPVFPGVVVLSHSQPSKNTLKKFGDGRFPQLDSFGTNAEHVRASVATTAGKQQWIAAPGKASRRRSLSGESRLSQHPV
jgi:hypothetical protein